MVNQTQMYPSSISPLGLFQEMICNNERLKGGLRSPEFMGRPKLKGGTSDSSSYHQYSIMCGIHHMPKARHKNGVRCSTCVPIYSHSGLGFECLGYKGMVYGVRYQGIF